MAEGCVQIMQDFMLRSSATAPLMNVRILSRFVDDELLQSLRLRETKKQEEGSTAVSCRVTQAGPAIMVGNQPRLHSIRFSRIEFASHGCRCRCKLLPFCGLCQYLAKHGFQSENLGSATETSASQRRLSAHAEG